MCTSAVPEVDGYVLHPMTIADASEWVEYATLPEVTRFTSSVVKSVGDLIPVIERTQSGEPGAPYLFAVRKKESRLLVATLGFHTVSALNRTAEITYTVRPDYWGMGLATRLCSAALVWAFGIKGWVRVQATTLEENVASQRVLSKSGFEFEGKLRNLRIVGGEPRDYLLFSRVPNN
jgi:[ribosomal protein S5]-alanine N-acetyltransferase